MKLRLPLLLLALSIAFVPVPSLAQTVDEVLSKGILLNDENIVLLKIETDGSILYQVWPKEKNKYRPLSEATLFMPTLDYAHICVRPVNPLNLSQKTNLVFDIDPIEKAATDAVALIVKSIQDHVKAGEFISKSKGGTIAKAAPKGKAIEPPKPPCNEFKEVLDMMVPIQYRLKDDRKPAIVNAFEKLKNMSFVSEAVTISELKEVDDSIQLIVEYCNNNTLALDNFKKKIESLSCGEERDVFINKFIFKSLLDEMFKVLNTQTTRLNNLKNVYKTVKMAQAEASVENEGELKWVIKLKPVEIKQGQISTYTLTIHDMGYSLSSDKEITKLELKEKSKYTLKFRRFQRFVPEVLAGTAYTRLRFPEFSTTKNAAGDEIIVESGASNVRRINFTTMVNLNYSVRHSNVHPFIQMGIGANVGYPTLLLGSGLRFKFNGIPAFTLACGGASSWIKELKTLKPNDKVLGMADVEKDITHTFNAPKIYYGIQIHL